MPNIDPSERPHQSADVPRKPGPIRAYGRSLHDFSPLSAAEERLLRHCSGQPPRDANGNPTERPEWCEIDPERPSPKPDAAKVIRASFIRFLLLGGDDQAPVHERGLWVRGAHIAEVLDLRGCECRLPLHLERCWFEGAILLQGAKLRFVNLTGSWLPEIKGDTAKIENGVILREVTTAGVIRFYAAEVSGDFDCADADLKHYDGSSLILTGATIKGVVRLSGRRFNAQGQVRLRNANIGGNLECIWGTFTGADLKGKTDQDKAALDFQTAKIAGAFDCRGAQFRGRDSSAVLGAGASIGGRSYLGCSARGEVQLYAASFGTHVSCLGGSFKNERGRAINLSTAQVKGDVLLSGDNFSAEGAVQLWGADISGDVDCRGANLTASEKDALVCASATIKGHVLLSGASVRGTLSLASAKVGGDMWFGGRLENPKADNPVLDCSAAKVGGSVYFEQGLTASGGVSFVGAEITGDLGFYGGGLSSEGRTALDCSAAKVRGSIYFEQAVTATATGGVSFVGAEITGNLNFNRGDLQSSAEGRAALDCSAAKVGGDVWFGPELKVTGGVKLHSARINRHLTCAGAVFTNQQGSALNCDAITVGGAVFMQRAQISSQGNPAWSESFKSNGEVRFVAADIRLQFICDGPELKNAMPGPEKQRAGWALNLSNARIADCLFLAVDRPGETPDRAAATIIGSLNLGAAQVRGLVDPGFVQVEDPDRYFPPTVVADGTPLECTVDLDGFVYERLSGDSICAFEARRHWLERQPRAHLAEDFRHQPFDHLGRVLRGMGHDDEARKIAILKQRLLTRRIPSQRLALGIGLGTVLFAAFFDPFPLAAATAIAAFFLLLFSNAGLWLWRTVVLDGLVAYGYRPAQALVIATVIALALGWFYDQAKDGGAIVEAEKAKVPGTFDFHPLIYSFDVMLPVVKLGEAEAWKPAHKAFTLHDPIGLREIRVGPEVTLYVVWAEKAFGWLAGAVLIAVVGGLIKKDS